MVRFNGEPDPFALRLVQHLGKDWVRGGIAPAPVEQDRLDGVDGQRSADIDPAMDPADRRGASTKEREQRLALEERAPLVQVCAASFAASLDAAELELEIALVRHGALALEAHVRARVPVPAADRAPAEKTPSMGPAAVSTVMRGRSARRSGARCPGGDQASGSRAVISPVKR